MQNGQGQTRCLVLARNLSSGEDNADSSVYLQRPTGKDHTLVVLSICHEPGALAKVLNLLDDHGVNMLELSSHMSVDSSSIFTHLAQFLVKFQGHAEEAPVKNALQVHVSKIDI